MKTIALCPNVHRDIDLAYTKKVAAQLSSLGITCLVCPMLDSEKKADTTEFESALQKAELVLCFGGDGTILHTARLAARFSVPVLGVNFGKMGFMAELEPDEMPKILDAVLGNYAIDERMMLDVSVIRENCAIFTDCVLNDAVISGLAAFISLSVYGDGRKIATYSGDGVVVSSPTGSTAYSMSAGGPIVEPDAQNIIVTPICAHSLLPKSFVLSPSRIATVEIEKAERKSAFLTLDGGTPFKLETGDLIRISRSAYTTKLVRLNQRSFYEIVNQKLVNLR